MNRISRLKFNHRIILVTIIFVGLTSIIFLAASSSYVERNILNDEEASLIADTEIQYNNILQRIEKTDLIATYVRESVYLYDYLERANEGTLTLDDKRYLLDSNFSGVETIINVNDDVEYIRMYSYNEDVTELMPSLYSIERIEDNEIYGTTGWIVDYSNDIFRSGDQSLVGNLFEMKNSRGEPIALVELAVSLDHMFYSGSNDDFETFIYNNSFHDISGNSEEVGITVDDLEDNASFLTDDYMVHVRYLSELDTYLVNVKNLSLINQGIMQVNLLIIGAIVIIVGVLSFLMNQIIKHMFERFYKVVDGVSSISDGNLDTVIEVDGHDEIHDLATEVNQMTSSLKNIMEESIEREVSEKDSQIKAMQSQINSHFIYNTLESIKMMAEIYEYYDMSDALTDLGKLLRYSMKWDTGLVIVEDELNHIASYLKLGDIRYDNKITFKSNLSEEMEQQVIPKMTFQPVIENAIRYGADGNDLDIEVNGYYEDDNCYIVIVDYGLGIDEERLKDLQAKIDKKEKVVGSRGSGIALNNVNKRIKVQFGEDYGIRLESKLNEYTKIIIKLPSTRKTEGD